MLGQTIFIDTECAGTREITSDVLFQLRLRQQESSCAVSFPEWRGEGLLVKKAKVQLSQRERVTVEETVLHISAPRDMLHLK